PGNWLRIQVRSSDGKAQLGRRKDDGNITTLATSSSALSLTSGTWYTAKVLVDDDPNNANLQRPGWEGHPARQRVDTED
ncbi:MAG: hypothetical protein ACE5I3_09875, partial [Phycisphaerae bacterium]